MLKDYVIPAQKIPLQQLAKAVKCSNNKQRVEAICYNEREKHSEIEEELKEKRKEKREKKEGRKQKKEKNKRRRRKKKKKEE